MSTTPEERRLIREDMSHIRDELIAAGVAMGMSIEAPAYGRDDGAANLSAYTIRDAATILRLLDELEATEARRDRWKRAAKRQRLHAIAADRSRLAAMREYMIAFAEPNMSIEAVQEAARDWLDWDEEINRASYTTVSHGLACRRTEVVAHHGVWAVECPCGYWYEGISEWSDAAEIARQHMGTPAHPTRRDELPVYRISGVPDQGTAGLTEQAEASDD